MNNGQIIVILKGLAQAKILKKWGWFFYDFSLGQSL